MKPATPFSPLALAAPAAGQAPVHVPESIPARVHSLPALRDQAVEQQAWLEARLDRVLPALMNEYGVHMWTLSTREYAEDRGSRLGSITAPTTFAARRRSIYVMTRQPDGTVERLALGGTSQGGVFEALRSTRSAPTQDTSELVDNEQWRLLRELVEDRDLEYIALNIDPGWAFSDGLHAGEREVLEEALGPYVDRVVREPRLALNYIALRIPEMTPRYRKIMKTVHSMISQAAPPPVARRSSSRVTSSGPISAWSR